MCLLSIKELFNQEIIQALCRTLVHSLWQGLLLAIVAALVIVLTRRSGPVLRYNLLSTLFVLFFLGSCITFTLQIHGGSGQSVVRDQPGLGTGLTAVTGPTGSAVDAPGARSGVGALQQTMEGFLDYCNANAYLLVTFWLVVLSARFVKLLAGLGKVQRLRHYRVHLPSGYWSARVQELAIRLRIKIRIGLLESELVKAPMVVGFLKPVILIPLGLLSQIPPDQVEAVLLHELAHVRRKDYFVNIIQSFTEMIFFFNPGVRWVSSLIRDEREHCCDDMAIVQTKNKQQFVEALVAFQEHYNTGLRPAMGFPGRGGSLLDRARRIIYNHNKTLNNMEKLFVAGSLLITSCLTLTVFAQKAPQSGPGKKDVPAVTQVISSTTTAPVPSTEAPVPPVPSIGAPVPGVSQAAPVVRTDTSISLLNGVYDINADGIQYRLYMDGDSLLILFVNGKRIPDDKLDEYRPKVEHMWMIMKEKLLEIQRNADVAKVEAEKYQRQAESMKIQAEKYSQEALLQKLASEDYRNQADPTKLQAEAVREQMEVIKKEAELMSLQAFDSQKHAAEIEAKANELKSGNKELRDQSDQMKLQAEELRKQATIMKLKAEIMLKNAAMAKQYAEKSKTESLKLVDDIRTDLVREHILKDKKELQVFTLDKEGLEVNEVRQSPAMYRKFKEKYLKDEKTRIYFNFRDNAKEVNISRVR